MAGQEAHVFQFADRAQVFFNCQIQLTVKEGASCEAAVPDCGQSNTTRQKRQANATNDDRRSEVEAVANFDLPPQKINVLFDLDDNAGKRTIIFTLFQMKSQSLISQRHLYSLLPNVSHSVLY